MEQIKCPKCGLEVNIESEDAKFIEEVGMCYQCDAHSIFDDLNDDDINNYLENL